MALLADSSADVGSNFSSDAVGSSRTFTMPSNVAIKVESVVATIDNTAGAANTAKLTIRDPSGQVIATKTQTSVIPSSDTGTATFALRLADEGGSSLAAISILDYVEFNPVAGFVQVTSNNPAAPDTIASCDPVTMDGATTLRFEFAAAGADVDQRGIVNTGALLFELYRDATALGIVGDLNASAGVYAEIPIFMVAFDTPPAGTVTYALKAYRQGGGGGAVGPTFVYGANLTTPHVTRPGYIALIEAVFVN